MTLTTKQYTRLKEQFEALADPVKAIKMSAYMKNHFAFYGIPAPERRKQYAAIIKDAKKVKHIDWELLDLAWKQPPREWHYFVCDYLIRLKALVTIDDLPKLDHFIRTQQWWDSIDQLDEIYGELVSRYPELKQLMLTFSKEPYFWIRRLAINHQSSFKENTDTHLLSQIIIANRRSQEFFINKAIGWALRDYSKTNPLWVSDFILTYNKQLSSLSIREASKYL
ncbi:DNA alkylation repair enzyme [Streptococcus agalactiae LMG 14747]|uniref:DNA alkylation repair enzyme n=1 Tax=Streptococcus agalactiae LMG 14747 TaxID=1154860 RepID=V6YYI9_STRAG|nr:DNA alkylation repair enzyme [Streptococcus agalactiae LMG 14747]